MKKVAVTTTSFAEFDRAPINLLESNGFEVVLNTSGKKLDANGILQICGGCIGIVAGTENYGRSVMEKISGLKIISRCGTAMENIDREAAASLGIKVANTPDAPTLAVAELTIGMMLSLMRHLAVSDHEIRKGIWKKRMGNHLSGKKVGIVGFGRIGRKVAELLTPFTRDIAYYDTQPAIGNTHTFMEFNDLLSWSDIITLHCPCPCDGNKIIGAGELKKMKRGAWLINASRGELVDEDALFNALKTQHLSGAALDVFSREPYTGKLSELDNVILTPHIGSYAKESRVEMEKQAVVNLLKGLEYSL